MQFSVSPYVALYRKYL